MHECQSTSTTIWVLVSRAVRQWSILERLQSQEPCSQGQAGLWFSQLPLALPYLRSRAIVHRWVSMVGAQGPRPGSWGQISISIFSRRVALQDASGESLGASQHVGLPAKAVLSQTFCCSYVYAWAEILQAQPYNPFLADIWSARVILYALLLGWMPFDVPDPAAPCLPPKAAPKAIIPLARASESPPPAANKMAAGAFARTKDGAALPPKCWQAPPFLAEGSAGGRGLAGRGVVRR
ncbi:PREDICTED: testis-specific serine/threonine-protein kinase 4-like [Haliaeetus leucocephalus]|uniref:testis-specific serine/threonine-protein kinase 4-like n=1 Tax=Haliaeetus leucocephalus TaxID=52644 RepID=UPI00053CE437|nr:PREDICTED: testis-specific serine/threonine-protein kinase 4-like [Haliaeetus leucocephalus]